LKSREKNAQTSIGVLCRNEKRRKVRKNIATIEECRNGEREEFRMEEPYLERR